MFQKLLLFFGICLGVNLSHAAPCSDYNTVFDGVRAARMTYGTECWLNVGEDFPPELIFRSYLITDSGSMMVFNSYGKEDTPGMTGARVFHFFPRTVEPDVVDTGTYLLVKTPNPSVVLKMERQHGRLLGLVRGVLKEAKEINRENNGGLEFKKIASGIMLDSGFNLDSDPTSDKDRTSIFRDRDGKSCTVKNHEVFIYPDDSDNLTFKFTTDKGLSAFLKQRCPALLRNF